MSNDTKDLRVLRLRELQALQEWMPEDVRNGLGIAADELEAALEEVNRERLMRKAWQERVAT